MAQQLLLLAGSTLAALLLGAGMLHLLPRLGAAGRATSAALCRGLGLDLVITYFTIAPLIVGPLVAGWPGLLAAVIAQVLTVVLWTVLHEAAHPAARRGPRVVHVLNRTVGRWRNHSAVWWTALAVPIFWIVRVGEWFVYPPLTWLVGLPRYRTADWINVSRQKFNGLVGHDLIWCLYCDWMTGVWSLASEMLRNVESFWCPIRFASPEKCANCRTDFPDVANGWVDASGSMSDVTAVLEKMYPPRDPRAGGTGGVRAWYGHPARLTVGGKPPSAPDAQHPA